MGFLLIKILGLLVLAAGCGAGAAYWWFRRHYEDVTPEYMRAREELQAWRDGFEERLAARPPVNLEPVAQQLAALHAAVSDIELPPPDFAPVHGQIEELAGRVAKLRIPEATDLSATNARLMAIEHALFPLQTRLDELSAAIRTLRTPEDSPQAPAAAAVANESAPELLAEPPAGAATVGNLLDAPVHGEPDDLTRIRGVPQVLEQTLHKVGVFYFWQIAEWSPEEVRYLDSQLEDFQGGIERDQWVDQAGELAAEPTAAPRPIEH
jgi:predicted flap endonuclease-1-like 5' DNA nuclease